MHHQASASMRGLGQLGEPMFQERDVAIGQGTEQQGCSQPFVAIEVGYETPGVSCQASLVDQVDRRALVGPDSDRNGDVRGDFMVTHQMVQHGVADQLHQLLCDGQGKCLAVGDGAKHRLRPGEPLDHAAQGRLGNLCVVVGTDRFDGPFHTIVDDGIRQIEGDPLALCDHHLSGSAANPGDLDQIFLREDRGLGKNG